MNNKKVIFIFFLSVNIFFFIVSLSYISKYKELKLLYLLSKKTINTQQTILDNYKEQLINNWLINNTKFSENFKLIDSSNISHNIKDTFKNKIVIFKFNKSNCTSCINKYLSRLKYIKNNKKYKNIILLINFDDFKYFERYKKYGLNCYAYHKKSFPAKLDKIEEPYFLLLDNSLTVKNVFTPDINKLELIEQYINKCFSNQSN